MEDIKTIDYVIILVNNCSIVVTLKSCFEVFTIYSIFIFTWPDRTWDLTNIVVFFNIYFYFKMIVSRNFKFRFLLLKYFKIKVQLGPGVLNIFETNYLDWPMHNRKYSHV